MENGVEQTVHPLLLYPVIKCMLKHATYTDLRNIRQVCRTWNDETYLFLSKRTKIIVDGEKQMSKFISDDLFPPCTTFEILHLSPSSLISFLLERGETIKSLTLRECQCSNLEMRQIIFDLLPNLVSFKIVLSSDESSLPGNGSVVIPIRSSASEGCLASRTLGLGGASWNWNIRSRRDSARSLLLGSFTSIKARVLPMYIGHHQGSLPKLRSLSLVGDFSYKSDVIFDILRNARNLEHIVARKRFDAEDDLFGTWFSEICFALKFPNVRCLELDVPLTWTQINSLLAQSFPLRRISMNFSNTPVDKLIYILERFHLLDSAEFGLENVPDSFINQLLQRFKKSQVWIAVHSKCDTKLIFPAHSYVVLENRL